MNIDPPRKMLSLEAGGIFERDLRVRSHWALLIARKIPVFSLVEKKGLGSPRF